MKKFNKHILTLMLVLVLIFSMASPAMAVLSTNETVIYEVRTESNDLIQITQEITSNGTILRQYDNGRLADEAFFENETCAKTSVPYYSRSDTFSVLSHTTASHGPLSSDESASVNALSVRWPITITYNTTDGSKAVEVSYTSSMTTPVVYQIPSMTVTLLDFISYIVTLLSIPPTLGHPIADLILEMANVAVVIGQIAFPGKHVSCTEIVYIYSSENKAVNGHTAEFISFVYTVADARENVDNPHYVSETFYEGWSPMTAWQDYEFARECFVHLFDYSSYTVTGWYPYGS